MRHYTGSRAELITVLGVCCGVVFCFFFGGEMEEGVQNFIRIKENGNTWATKKMTARFKLFIFHAIE